MAELKRCEYAYLFQSILEKYMKVLKSNGLNISRNATQNTILGIGSDLEDLTNNKITSSTNSISHVIYYTLCKRNATGEVEGFPERNNTKGGLLFQGADLYKGFRSYNNGNEIIELSDNYLGAYLDFIGMQLDVLSTKSKSASFRPPEKLKIFHTLQKPRKNKPNGKDKSFPVEFTYDIFLASPKLTLGRKIDFYYKNFEENIKDKLGGKISLELRDALTQHFFGFLPDLDSEYKSFEKYIDGLFKKLKKLGFRVYDSRKGMGKEDVRNFGKAGDQLKKDKKIIAKSRTYILVAPYPRLFTSAWLEAGVALGFGKPCIFICRDRTDDLLWVLQNDSKELGIEIIEYRELFDTKLSDRINLTASRITRTNAFRCDACALEDGLDGFIGDQKCPQCSGKGYHPRK